MCHPQEPQPRGLQGPVFLVQSPKRRAEKCTLSGGFQRIPSINCLGLAQSHSIRDLLWQEFGMCKEAIFLFHYLISQTIGPYGICLVFAGFSYSWIWREKKKKLSVVEKSMHLSLTQIYHVAGIDARVMPRLLTLSLSPFAREIWSEIIQLI